MATGNFPGWVCERFGEHAEQRKGVVRTAPPSTIPCFTTGAVKVRVVNARKGQYLTIMVVITCYLVNKHDILVVRVTIARVIVVLDCYGVSRVSVWEYFFFWFWVFGQL